MHSYKPEHSQLPSIQEPWNKRKTLGQKRPLKLKEIWGIRIRLELAGNSRELTVFNLAIDSKLRGCDLMSIRVRDIAHGRLYKAEHSLCSRKRIALFNLKLPKIRGIRW
ncbi:MAG: hypothetical protein V7707_06915 [Motiliproteus sp.]